MIADPCNIIDIVDVPVVIDLGNLAAKDTKHRQGSNLHHRYARMIISPSKYFMKILLSPA